MQDTISKPVVARGVTGAVCEESGPYVSADEGKPADSRTDTVAKVIVFFRKGQSFPVNSDGTVTTWTIVREGKELVNGRLVPTTP